MREDIIITSEGYEINFNEKSSYSFYRGILSNAYVQGRLDLRKLKSKLKDARHRLFKAWEMSPYTQIQYMCRDRKLIKNSKRKLKQRKKGLI
ncbi:MAG: hypothetical protein GXY87_03135 [Tissierellia bacterium]|nr:hypothetical protein [Tissierellia bacterium]